MALSVFRNITFLIVLITLIGSGCKSSQKIQEAIQEQASQPEAKMRTGDEKNKLPNSSKPNSVIVTYQNQSSNIQITLDPGKDEFYLDLKGMTPTDRDSIVVPDSSLIKSRATDIQTLLSSYRKAQDLFYLGEYQDALELINTTLEIQETADAYALKGTIFFMLENVTAAKANWNRAVQMDPNIPVPSIPDLETLIEEMRRQENE